MTYPHAWLKACAFTATALSLFSASPALADKKQPSVNRDLRGEPMTELVRSSIIRNEDADAVIETVTVCKKYAPAFKDGSANRDTVDQLSDEMATVTSRHFQRMQVKSQAGGALYFRGFPVGYVPPKDPVSLTCQAITGVAVPEATFYISRSYYQKKMGQWKQGAYAQRNPSPDLGKTREVVASATDAKPDDKATVPEDKAPKDGQLPPGKPPVAKGASKAPAFEHVEGRVNSTCEPETFKVKSKTDEGITLHVRRGATQWQLNKSCWAKDYEVAPAAVVLANKVESTLPYCTAKPHALPGEKDFDPQHWNLGRKGFLALGADANKAFVEKCNPDNFGYALRAGFDVFLPKKQAADTAAADAEAQKQADAKKAADEAAAAKAKADADAAEAAKKAAEASKVTDQADAGVVAPAGSGSAAAPAGSVEVSTEIQGLDGGSAGAASTPGSAAPVPTASGPPPL